MVYHRQTRIACIPNLPLPYPPVIITLNPHLITVLGLYYVHRPGSDVSGAFGGEQGLASLCFGSGLTLSRLLLDPFPFIHCQVLVNGTVVSRRGTEQA